VNCAPGLGHRLSVGREQGEDTLVRRHHADADVGGQALQVDAAGTDKLSPFVRGHIDCLVDGQVGLVHSGCRDARVHDVEDAIEANLAELCCLTDHLKQTNATKVKKIIM
jgi:hypothetical protein